MQFQQVLKKDGSWKALYDQWAEMCAEHDATIDDFGPIDIFQQLVDEERDDAGVFSVIKDGTHLSACQLNVTRLPKIRGLVLRVRHITVNPTFDFEDVPVDEYGALLAGSFLGVIEMSHGRYKSDRIHIHLKSPADRNFFTTIGQILEEKDVFKSITPKGMWLYIEK